ncbi:hypothetical protein DM826_00595 [Halonotius aquaticus]|uniref:Bacteriocin biosynthesis cyclodehydratase domain-containing protein n=1 Tax=Halonotius aquaticus TaxID=2216978 RepID=A0A3A6PXD0_9EURY|nr:hypothetical protein [Halonotius aquaticus]RJX45227.1 hypothetical protein DM826_00595 [Halonotius aquaticus]
METYPAAYSPTSYGRHDGEAVIRTPHATKTLQGGGLEAICTLLATMDGTTPASDLIAQVPDSDPEQIDLLYGADIAYDAQAIPAGLAEAGWERYLEPVLSAMSQPTQQTLPDRLAARSVAVFGEYDPVSGVCDRLRAAGVSVSERSATDPQSHLDDPDVIFLSEQIERGDSWRAANEAWATSSATLIKTRLTATGWRLGPVLTADARACLNCVYTRVDANKAGGQLFDETVTGTPPYMQAYTDTVTELLFRALVAQLPRYLDDQFVVYDHYQGRRETPRVFASPQCKICDNASSRQERFP